MPQLDASHYFSQFFWLCVSLTVLVVAFKKCFIPRMDKIFHGREQRIKACSDAIEKLERDISESKMMIKQICEDGLRRSAEIVSNSVKKYENALNTQLKFMRAENEVRMNATRSRIRKEIDGLESVFKMQVEITAQTAFERLFSRKL
jgi:F0F1-type ATP synthase membrane subunit b/b'